MGYSNVFWVNEKPIRTFINKNSILINEKASRDKIAIESDIVGEVGNGILKLTVHDSFKGGHRFSSQDALGAEKVFNSVGSFHSTDFAILIWTGNQLINFVDASHDDFRCLEKLDILSESSNWITSLTTADRNSLISRVKNNAASNRNNPLNFYGMVSIWSVIEDFTRECIHAPENEWPIKQVGSAFLDLMLDNWNRSRDITFHGGYGAAITRIGTFIISEFACLFGQVIAYGESLPLMNQKRRGYMSI